MVLFCCDVGVSACNIEAGHVLSWELYKKCNFVSESKVLSRKVLCAIYRLYLIFWDTEEGAHTK